MQTSNPIECGGVRVTVTENCGMLTADFDGILPFSVAPWTPDECGAGVPPLLHQLRGDFDCWFGGNGTPANGVTHRPHGDPCNLPWRVEEKQAAGNGSLLRLAMDAQAIPGNVIKKVALHPGHPVVYTQTLHRVDARLSVGHHATLRIPESADYHVSVSPFVYGSTALVPFLDAGAKPRLAVGAEFSSLSAIPAKNGGAIDLNSYYKTRGCDDLLMVSNDSSRPMAWAALTNRSERYVFFTLRDPSTLASTMFWLSHFGRDQAPWGKSGVPRHGFVMGMENVTALFDLGIAESLGLVEKFKPACERLHKLGVKTYLDFTAANPPPINYIMGAVRVPGSFGGVADIVPADRGVTLVDISGQNRVEVPVRLAWLKAKADAGLEAIA
jgi:hypothetical protein